MTHTKHINIIDDNKRVSTLAINGAKIEVIGILPHHAVFTPLNKHDAELLKDYAQNLPDGLDDNQHALIGKQWACFLGLKRSKSHKDRYVMAGGDKSDLGVYHTMRRLILENGSEGLL